MPLLLLPHSPNFIFDSENAEALRVAVLGEDGDGRVEDGDGSRCFSRKNGSAIKGDGAEMPEGLIAIAKVLVW